MVNFKFSHIDVSAGLQHKNMRARLFVAAGVRLVAHLNLPKTLEGLYQESGRAGRDGLPSRSVLFYDVDDRERMDWILSETQLCFATSHFVPSARAPALMPASHVGHTCAPEKPCKG